MGQRVRRVEWFVAAVCVLLAGCSGGHGPTLPSPDGGGNTLSGVVQVENFVVEAGETVQCAGDVTVECTTATIEGNLVAQDAAGAGADGSSITIEATGDVFVSGTVVAGSGVEGGTDADGGSGGDLTITSTDGDVTIGAGVDAESVRPAQADRALIQAGDGAGGGDGYHGGAGGDGGTITVSAENGTLHIQERPNLFGMGDGGDGGQAAIFGDDMLTHEPAAEPTNDGGDSGQLLLGGQDVQGVTFEDTGETEEGLPVWVIRLEGDTVIGGAGGDGGDAYWGVDPETGETSGPAMLRPLSSDRRNAVRTSDADEIEPCGGHGGNGAFNSGNGGQGVSDARGEAPYPDDSYYEGEGVGARAFGGDGGDVELTMKQEADAWVAGDARKPIVVGNGGDATALGGRGANGGYGSDGKPGGGAEATGGDAGSFNNSWLYSEALITPGRGGNATATGGTGGNGGAACNPPHQPGGDGGGGGNAEAEGGAGSKVYNRDPDLGGTLRLQGVGGNAEAVGGNGGDGGQGFGGGAGEVGGTAGATPGDGDPGGWATEREGQAGANGALCPVEERTTNYSVLVRPSMSTSLSVFSNLFSVTTQQSDPDRLIENLPANEGQSMHMTADRSVLWVAAEGRVLHVPNPLGPGASSDFGLTPDGGPAGRGVESVWLDESRDLLYASRDDGLYIWENASTLTQNTPATHRITITGWELWSIVGDEVENRLYAVGFNPQLFHRVLVFDDASELRDTVAPNREMEGVSGSKGLAYDPTRDLLYASGAASLRRVANASHVEGAVDVVAVEGPATGFERAACALNVFPDTDLIFAQEYGGPLHVYENASTVAGNVAPNLTQDVGTAQWPLTMTAWGVAQ